MPTGFQSNGLFQRTRHDWQYNAPIRRSDINGLFDEAERALGQCVNRDGQGAPTANLPMGGRWHTGGGDGHQRNEYAALGQLDDRVLGCGATSGMAGAYVVTPPRTVPELVAWARYLIVPHLENEVGCTVAIGSLPPVPVPVRRADGTAAAAAAGDLRAGVLTELVCEALPCAWSGLPRARGGGPWTLASGPAIMPIRDRRECRKVGFGPDTLPWQH